MRKPFFISIICLMAAAFAVAVVSCKKENENTTQEAPTTEKVAADNMDEYLMAFKKKLLSAQKGDETLSIEQAQSDLGNLLNFDFGDANYATNEVQYDTLFVPLRLVEGKVDLAQLAGTYHRAFIQVREVYGKVDIPEKSVLYISCSINNKAKDSESTDVMIILATRGLIGITMKTSFDSTDNWRVCDSLGKCDGTCVGDDHMTMLKKVYENNRPLLGCPNGRVYFTDIWDEGIVSALNYQENDPDIHYNYGYRLWCGLGSEAISHCVEYPEMQYYYNNFVEIMEYEAYRPQGHVVTDIHSLHLDCIVSVNPDVFYLVSCLYSTGKPNCSNEGPYY
jgi:hypothetical protein